jgi:hypothetical protein
MEETRLEGQNFSEVVALQEEEEEEEGLKPLTVKWITTMNLTTISTDCC